MMQSTIFTTPKLRTIKLKNPTFHDPIWNFKISEVAIHQNLHDNITKFHIFYDVETQIRQQ